MVHAIFCAHGQLAGAMLDSVCMVYGEVNVSAVAFVPAKTRRISPLTWKS
ncbi:sorbose-specific phosphotransferase enzyme IIA component [Klebsiella pneumoniae]|nr:sorbose-specific phosphotransferase enzyme IIA component [Klebsiella pneumoniae]